MLIIIRNIQRFAEHWIEKGQLHLILFIVPKVCFHVFASAGSLERHARGHCLEKPYQCGVCSKGFGRKEHLENHCRSHSGETPYRCQFCDKSFSRKEHMVNHTRKHTGKLFGN